MASLGNFVSVLVAVIFCALITPSAGLSASCSSVVPTARLECGFSGITGPQCLTNASCCYDNTISGVKWCFIDPAKNPCDSNPCKNSGTCKPIDGNVFNCQCPVGYSGSTCDLIVACNPSPCLNGGTCSPDGSGFLCSCASGFTGTKCDTATTEIVPPECSGFPYFVRSYWNARDPKSPIALQSPVSMVIVHETKGSQCSNTSECVKLIQQIQNKDMDVSGFSDITFNFLVAPGGGVYEGRGWDSLSNQPPAQYQPDSINIAAIGTYDTITPFDRTLESLQKLILCGVKLGKLSPTFHMYGHRDFDCAGHPKCPGDKFYNIIKTWTGTYRYGGAVNC